MEFFLILAAIILHELGHIGAIYLFGGKIKKIKLRPVGITVITDGKLFNYAEDVIIALAGPFIGILTFILFKNSESSSLSFLSLFSLSLSVMNLLPIKKLDGGRAVLALLSSLVETSLAEKIASALSFVFMFFLWMTAIYITLMLKSNLSLYFVALWLFKSDFIDKNKV